MEEARECIRITRCGRNTKIHAVMDVLGNSIHVKLSSRVITGEYITEDCLDFVNLNDIIVQTDKAYGFYRLRKHIAICIPLKSNTVDSWFGDCF